LKSEIENFQNKKNSEIEESAQVLLSKQKDLERTIQNLKDMNEFVSKKNERINFQIGYREK